MCLNAYIYYFFKKYKTKKYSDFKTRLRWTLKKKLTQKKAASSLFVLQPTYLEPKMPQPSLTSNIWDNMTSVPLNIAVLEKYDLQTKEESKKAFIYAIKNVKRRATYNKKTMEAQLSMLKLEVERVYDKSVTNNIY